MTDGLTRFRDDVIRAYTSGKVIPRKRRLFVWGDQPKLECCAEGAAYVEVRGEPNRAEWERRPHSWLVEPFLEDHYGLSDVQIRALHHGFDNVPFDRMQYADSSEEWRIAWEVGRALAEQFVDNQENDHERAIEAVP